MDVFLVKSMETIDPRGMAKFDPRGMIGTLYNRDYQTLLHTKREALGLVVSEKKIFLETINPRGVAKFDPMGMAGTIYVEDH